MGEKYDGLHADARAAIDWALDHSGADGKFVVDTEDAVTLPDDERERAREYLARNPLLLAALIGKYRDFQVLEEAVQWELDHRNARGDFIETPDPKDALSEEQRRALRESILLDTERSEQLLDRYNRQVGMKILGDLGLGRKNPDDHGRGGR